ncbi:hypothetical protein NQZ79_g3744 [Umbelopsis isabellina]|nr:hypothetical protein NQZ79_g3744 [Umbelopsis isabellina]
MQTKNQIRQTDLVIQHRHAQIQSLSKLVHVSDLKDLWQALASANTPLIAFSYTCAQIVQSVEEGTTDLGHILDQLVGFITTVFDTTKSSVLLRAITHLLLWHCQQEQTRLNFSLHASKQGHVHPYITLLKQGHVTSGQMMIEIDYAIEQDTAMAFSDRWFATFAPVFDTILLLSTSVEPSALITRISKCIRTPASDIYDELRDQALNYLISAADRYYRNDSYLQLMLLSELTSLLTECSDLHALLDGEDLGNKTTGLLYKVLQVAIDAKWEEQLTLPYLNLVQQLVFATDLCENEVPICRCNRDLLWICLSFLLLDAQTYEDQRLLVDLLSKFIPTTSPCVLQFALLPLLQALTEVNNDINIEDKSAKLEILQIVQQIQKQSFIDFHNLSNVKNDICRELKNYSIDGLMLYAITLIVDSEDAKVLSLQNADTDSEQAAIEILLLRMTPYLFNFAESNQLEKASDFARIVSVPSTASKKFPAFLLFLHVLRQSQNHPEYTNHILQNVIPTLVHPSDSLLTSKILKTSMSLIQGRTPQHRGIFQKDSMTSVTSVGIKMLYNVYRRQPRVWQYLKLVILEWINYRKASTQHYSKTPSYNEYETEMAILTTVRDCLEIKPQETGEDILPGIISLLQNVPDLSMPSIALIVESITACVKSELLEARSTNYAIAEDKQNDPSVIFALCKFYEFNVLNVPRFSSLLMLSGSIESEAVSEMRQTILLDQLAVYMESDDEEIKCAALSALSHFRGSDIIPLMQERPKDSIQSILTYKAVEEYAQPLAKLMTFELDHMRRGLFKDGDSQRTNTNQGEKIDPTSSSTEEQVIMQRIYKDWTTFQVSPGLRSGFALASLFSLNQERSEVQEWQRIMESAFTDVNLSDHWLTRVASLSAWQAFFEDTIGNDLATAEKKSESALDDLLKRLASSKIPGLTCNILMALTGCVLTLHKISPSASTARAVKILNHLFANYFVSNADKNSTASSQILNDDVQFAVRFCIGHIGECVVSNEQMTIEIISQLRDDLLSYRKGLPIDTAVEIQPFSSGYSLAHLVSAVKVYPTKTQVLEDVAKNETNFLFDTLISVYKVSESVALGILLGFASNLDSEEMTDVITWAEKVVTNHTNKTNAFSKGTICGSFWVLAYASVLHIESPENMEVQKLYEAASMYWYKSQNELNELYVVPYAFALQRLARSTQHIHIVQPHLVQLLDELYPIATDSNSSMSNKITAIMGLSCILGIDYLNGPLMNDDPGSNINEEQHHNATAHYKQQDITQALKLQLGFGDTKATGNLRAGRIAAYILGNLYRKSVAKQKYNHADSNPDELERLATVSTETKSYSRLSQATSWLRNVFDALNDISLNLESGKIEDNASKARMLMSALQQTIGPLPLVNWFPILLRLSKVDAATHLSCIRFAHEHATYSSSLVEFLIVQCRQLATELDKKQSVDRNVLKMLVSEAGLGLIISLTGLEAKVPARKEGHHRRGMNAIVRKISVSDDRCMETIQAFTSTFDNMNVECQTTLLQTICNYLPENTSNQLANSIRNLVSKEVLAELLEKVDAIADQVIRYAARSSFMKIEEQLSFAQLNDRCTSQQLHTVAIVVSEACYKSRTGGRNQKWLIELLKSFVTFDGTVLDNSWKILVQALVDDASDSELEKYEWLTRVLDVLIVVLSSKNSKRSYYASSAIAHCLRSVIEVYWWSLETIQEDSKLAISEATYLLSKATCVSAQVGVVQNQVGT